MVQSTALLIVPPTKPEGEEKDAIQATAQLPIQALEDRCLAERIECALRATGYGPLRRIEVAVQTRLVILAGRVPSYYLKQIAQTVALVVPGTHRVRNNLEVV